MESRFGVTLSPNEGVDDGPAIGTLFGVKLDEGVDGVQMIYILSICTMNVCSIDCWWEKERCNIRMY